MNLYQLVQGRKPLNFAQQFGLITCLSSRLRQDDREKLRVVITNLFYSTFEDKEFGKQFILYDDGIEFVPIVAKNRNKELKVIQKYILALA